MMNWWRKSLAVQLLASMLLALFVSQAIGFAISWNGYIDVWRTAARAELQSRSAAVARLIEVAPTALRGDLARVNSTDYTRFWVSDKAPGSLDVWTLEAFNLFRIPLRRLLNGSTDATPVGSPPASTILASDAQADLFSAGAAWTTPGTGEADMPAQAHYLDFAEKDGAGVIVPLSDGRMLNVAFYKRWVPTMLGTQIPVTLALTACLVSLVGVIATRRISRPLRSLTKAAETLGRGEPVTPLAETGPDDIRRTAEAFNRMQERLHRFVKDRTRMLAALGHDLRTPLTTLRLRTELVSDVELQEKMLTTLDEIQAMTEATLTLAQQETSVEKTRTIDLAALVESICEDQAELGHDVTLAATSRVPYRCRPDALRRTVRNLIENSVRYAGHANVRLVQNRSSIEIVVEDNGPGIPGDKLEEVFAPFFRLETSRSRETGGIGLGLSIARAIARQHGGDIVLSPSSPGLKASVLLPL